MVDKACCWFIQQQLWPHSQAVVRSNRNLYIYLLMKTTFSSSSSWNLGNGQVNGANSWHLAWICRRVKQLEDGLEDMEAEYRNSYGSSFLVSSSLSRRLSSRTLHCSLDWKNIPPSLTPKIIFSLSCSIQNQVFVFLHIFHLPFVLYPQFLPFCFSHFP